MSTIVTRPRSWTAKQSFDQAFYTKQISKVRWELAGYTIIKGLKGYSVECRHVDRVEMRYLHTLTEACRFVRNIYIELWMKTWEIENEKNLQ